MNRISIRFGYALVFDLRSIKGSIWVQCMHVFLMKKFTVRPKQLNKLFFLYVYRFFVLTIFVNHLNVVFVRQKQAHKRR